MARQMCVNCCDVIGPCLLRYKRKTIQCVYGWRAALGGACPLDLPQAQVVVLDCWRPDTTPLLWLESAKLRINAPWNMHSGDFDFRPEQPTFISCNWQALCGKRQMERKWVADWCLGHVWPRFISIKESLYWEMLFCAVACEWWQECRQICAARVTTMLYKLPCSNLYTLYHRKAFCHDASHRCYCDLGILFGGTRENRPLMKLTL